MDKALAEEIIEIMDEELGVDATLGWVRDGDSKLYSVDGNHVDTLIALGIAFARQQSRRIPRLEGVFDLKNIEVCCRPKKSVVYIKRG